MFDYNKPEYEGKLIRVCPNCHEEWREYPDNGNLRYSTVYECSDYSTHRLEDVEMLYRGEEVCIACVEAAITPEDVYEYISQSNDEMGQFMEWYLEVKSSYGVMSDKLVEAFRLYPKEKLLPFMKEYLHEADATREDLIDKFAEVKRSV